MPFLSFLKSESEGQSSDPVVAAAPSSEEHPLPKSLDEDGDADAVTKAIGTLRAIFFSFLLFTVRPLNIQLPVTHSSDSSHFIDLYITDKLKPALTKITFGSLVGYCSGVATKKIGRALAIVAGVGFMLVQGAVYSGYIDVDWKKVQDDVASKVDANKDGALNAEDAKEYWKKLKAILTHNIPNAGGFSLGFLYGVTYA